MSKSHLVVLAIVIASGPTWAEPTKYTRTQDVKIDVKLSDRVKARAPVKQEPKPALTGAQALEVEGLKGVYQAQQEQLLIDLIKDTADTDPDKPKYLFMLGELYAKQQRYYRLRS